MKPYEGFKSSQGVRQARQPLRLISALFSLMMPALLAETAKALRQGTRDVIEYINDVCDNIDVNEPKIQALLPEPNRRGRLIREAAELKWTYNDPSARPILYGIPVGVKDIFRVDGFPTKAGSKLPEKLFAGREAACVTWLRRAGAIILGKTATTEFAYFEPGPTCNPHNLTHTPGGSSSGSAAGVASGFFPLALGTQTIGSIIRPAAFCGVIGFKPSFDRIPTNGVIPFSHSADHVGFFTQDIEGVDLAASALCDNWQSQFAAMPPQEQNRLPVLGVPDGKYLMQASGAALTAFDAQIATLTQAGYTVKHVPMFTDIDEINHRHRQMIAAEFAEVHHDWFEEYMELYRRRTVQLIFDGRDVSADALAHARNGRQHLRETLEASQNTWHIDIWISPAAPGEAPEGIQATGDPVMNFPWTHAGVPTLTIPAGLSQNNLPLGLQCAAAFMRDEQLVFWARGLMESL